MPGLLLASPQAWPQASRTLLQLSRVLPRRRKKHGNVSILPCMTLVAKASFLSLFCISQFSEALHCLTSRTAAAPCCWADKIATSSAEFRQRSAAGRSDRSPSDPVAATALSYGSLPQLSSIQLLELRAQQHMAHAGASLTSWPAAVSQSHGQPLQAWGSLSPTGACPQPQGGPAPWMVVRGFSRPEQVSAQSACGRQQGDSSKGSAVQPVYAPAGIRAGQDTMQALLSRLRQERSASLAVQATPAAAPSSLFASNSAPWSVSASVPTSMPMSVPTSVPASRVLQQHDQAAAIARDAIGSLPSVQRPSRCEHV